ncbi:MAG TPA: SH3 domain-containing protein, partial [Phototrophicaceae bacterium]|nr:SH3 domain-containing protein [Phototrophicaceae bacterium]
FQQAARYTEQAAITATARVTQAAIAAQTTPAKAEGETVTAAQVRSGPGAGYALVSSLASGAAVTVIGQDASGQWVQVRLDGGQTGWIPQGAARVVDTTNRVFGPARGELVMQDDGYIKANYAQVSMRDFVAEVVFAVPYRLETASWDIGFVFRDAGWPEQLRLGLQAGIADDGSRFQYWELAGFASDESYQSLASGYFDKLLTDPGAENHVKLVGFENTGFLFVNDAYVTTLDLGYLLKTGDIAVATSLFSPDTLNGEKLVYRDFRIWNFTGCIVQTGDSVDLKADPDINSLDSDGYPGAGDVLLALNETVDDYGRRWWFVNDSYGRTGWLNGAALRETRGNCGAARVAPDPIIAYGETVQSFQPPESSETLFFDGAAGDVVRINIAATETTEVNIYDAPGNFVYHTMAGGDYDAVTETFTLTSSGQHRIEIASSYYYGEGGYTFSLELTEQAKTIAYGGQVTGSLATDQIVFFEGTAGDIITLKLQAPGIVAIVKLVDSTGAVLLETYQGNEDYTVLVENFAVPADDTYQLVIHPQEASTFTLTLELVGQPQDIHYGEVLTGPQPMLLVFFFDGQVGDQIYLNWDASDWSILEIYDPANTLIASSDRDDTPVPTGNWLLELTTSGRYRLQLRAYEAIEYTYRLGIENLKTVPEIAYGEVIRGQYDFLHPFRMFTLKGQKGDQIIARYAGFQDSYVRLFDPRTRQDVAATYFFDQFGTVADLFADDNIMLPDDGEYQLIVRLDGDPAGAFTVIVLKED